MKYVSGIMQGCNYNMMYSLVPDYRNDHLRSDVLEHFRTKLQARKPLQIFFLGAFIFLSFK